MAASDRQAVTAAQTAIDSQLAFSPETKGTVVAEGLRKLIVKPLKVFFEVSALDYRVKVISVFLA